MPDLQGVNWDDVESKLRTRGGNLYDPTDLEGIKRNTGYETGAMDLDTSLNNAYANYDQRRGNTPGPAEQTYSSGAPGAAGGGDQALSSYLDYIKTRDSAAQSNQAQMRQILMQQLGQDQQPVSADQPGIREVLGGQRLALQRGAERQRAGAAELRAYDGSGGLGGKAFDSDVNRIEQQRTESDAQMTGGVLHQELQDRQQRLTQRLALAMQLGDAESARLLQAQLNAIQTQLSQSNFYDDSAYRYSALNQQGNLQALMAMLGAY